MNRLFKPLVDALFPPRCVACTGVLSLKEDGICKKCRNALVPVQMPVCMKCGKGLSEKEKEYCYDCERKNFSYEKGYSMWVYNETMQRSIAAFKYHGMGEFKTYYAEQMIKRYGMQLRKLSLDAVIPVPMYEPKKKKRGYNQAELIAGEIGRRLGVPVMSDYLIRNRNTKPQKELNDVERLENLQNAFAVNSLKQRKKKMFLPKRVLLVDDIYTTGSTVELCSRVLKAAGTEAVYVLTVSIGRGK